MGEQTAMTKWYYICNVCGSIVTIEAAPIAAAQAWECANCGGSDMTEFTNQQTAVNYGERIREDAYAAEMARLKAMLERPS